MDFRCNGGVHFRGDDDLGFTRKVGIVLGEFGVNRVELIDGIAVAHFGHVDQMEQQPCAFDVLQELDTEAGAKMRAFNEAGNVRYHERPVGIEGDDAEVRLHRRERIFGDLGSRGRDARNERGLAHVRVAH